MHPHQIRLLVITRLIFGLLFLLSGIDKALSGFSASGYLQHATYGPFAQAFQTLAGNPVADFLVVFGEIAIGLALISGVVLTFTAVAGSLMMALFYLSAFPPETGVIDLHVIYILVFWLLAVFKAGNYWGLGEYSSEVIDRFIKKK